LTIDDYSRSIEERRDRTRAALRGPTSELAAVARHQLPVGSRLRFGSGPGVDVALQDVDRVVDVRATGDGFVVDGEPGGPRQIDLGRFRLRLSHQNAPAVVVLDRESPRLLDDVERRWYPVDPALRFVTTLEPDRERGTVASTNSADRVAERLGWLPVVIEGVHVRVAATRLLEPGFADGHIDVYFRDATTGRGSYEVGRYLTVEREGEAYVVDFNLAYNPSCALSPYYNCPIPPRENHLVVPIRAGEMTPLVRSGAHPA
jgi:uncharacterized protein (DUF1684 family)